MPESSFITARWVLPIEKPAIARGWLEVRDRRIVRVGDGAPPSVARDLGSVAVLPALVNAHTHLELSWMRGRVPPAGSFMDWLRALLAERADASVGPEAKREAMVSAAAEMRRTGTVAIGDVSNALTSIEVLREAGLVGTVFHELLGFSPSDARSVVNDAWIRLAATFGPRDAAERAEPSLSACVVAHAPYSVSPELIAEIATRHPKGPLAVHLAESVEEVELLRRGTGPMKALLQELNVWRPGWAPPACDPTEYLDRLGYLRRALLVHCVHLSQAALDRIRTAEGVIVTCPRSNTWVGTGLPPVSRFYASGIDVAIGTDSLASVATLNLFDELAEMRRVAPEVAAASFLESATRVGAKALGIDAHFGTLAPGKRSTLVAVEVPDGESDVEEYLVSGVPPSAVQLLEL
jgi:aminodeoxyfutalosine deaminase